MHLARFSLIVISLLTLSSCMVNPVTGKRELSLMSQEQQIAMGEQYYKPYQQQQGGVYIVDPNLNVYVRSIGQKLAAVSDQKNLPYDFVVLNDSTPNAWALPGGKIAINRGLLLLMEDESQLAAVLAHEIVHAAAGHSALQQTRSSLLGLGASAISLLGGRTDYGALIDQGLGLGVGAVSAQYGRWDELEADAVGVRYMIDAGYDPNGAVELQQKFVELSQGRERDIMSSLFASHPPSQKRVELNRELAANKTGVRNKKAYQRAIKQLQKDAKAYRAHDQALKAASEKNFTYAMSLVNSAIKQQPQEAIFYVTKGQLLAQNGKQTEALAAFKTASSKNPEYVMGYLNRGITEYKLKKTQDAQNSLITAERILRTPIANFYLGEIFLGQGNSAAAADHYRFAAQDSGEVGNAAKGRLAKMGQTQ